jgi:RNA polymerase sigma factor FliA
MTGQSENQNAGVEQQQASDTILWLSFKSTNSQVERSQLFRHYQALATNMAARYKRSHAGANIEYTELFQLACLGLLEAIDRFKPELNIPFRYYANRRMSGSILNGIAKYSEVNQQISTSARMAKARASSLQSDIVLPRNTDEKINLLAQIAAGLALGFMLEDAKASTGESITQDQDAFASLAWKQSVKRVRDEMMQLPKQQANVMIWHYYDGLQFDQIAAIMNLSKGRISQIHKAAIALLRKRLLQADNIWFEG